MSQTKIVVRLDDGVSVDQFRTAIDTLPDSAELSIGPAQLISAQMRRAVDTQGAWPLDPGARLRHRGDRRARADHHPPGPTVDIRASATVVDRLHRRSRLLTESVLRASLPIVAGCRSRCDRVGRVLRALPDRLHSQDRAAPRRAGRARAGPARRRRAHRAALLLWTAVSLVLTRSDIRSVRPVAHARGAHRPIPPVPPPVSDCASPSAGPRASGVRSGPRWRVSCSPSRVWWRRSRSGSASIA